MAWGELSEETRLEHRHMCRVWGHTGESDPGPCPRLRETRCHPLALAMPLRHPSPLQEGSIRTRNVFLLRLPLGLH